MSKPKDGKTPGNALPVTDKSVVKIAPEAAIRDFFCIACNRRFESGFLVTASDVTAAFCSEHFDDGNAQGFE